MARAAARIEPPKSKAKICAHGVAPELQRHQRQEHALAGARRTHDQRVADVANVQIDSRNGVAPSVLPNSSGGASRCSSRSGPAQTAESGIMWARLSVLETGGCRTLA